MKTFFKLTFSCAVLMAGLSGTASAEPGEKHPHQIANPQTTASVSRQHTQILASSLFITKDLQRRGLEPNDLVEVTVYPTTDQVEQPRGGER